MPNDDHSGKPLSPSPQLAHSVLIRLSIPNGSFTAMITTWRTGDLKVTRTLRRLAMTLITGLVAATVLAPSVGAAAPSSPGRQPPPAPTVAVRIIAMNDFHGNLQPPSGSSGRVTLDDGKTTVDAGGAA